MEPFSINPDRLQQFTRHVIIAAKHRQQKQETVVQVQQHVEKIKQFAEHKKIKKHALRKELDALHEKISAILDVERDISVKEQDVAQAEDRTAETAEDLKKRIAFLEQKLTLFNEKYSDDVLIFVEKLEKVNKLLAQLCRKMDVPSTVPDARSTELEELSMRLSQLEISARVLQEQGHSKTKVNAIKKKIKILQQKVRKAKRNQA